MVAIQRLHCAQLPEIAIIAIEGNPMMYFAHAQQVIGLLLNKTRRNATEAMRAFFNSEAGKHIKHGGDLRTSFQNGPMTAMIYTYHLGNGGGGKNPSFFATPEAVKEIMKNLPNQDETAKQKYYKLFEDCFDHIKAATILQPATQEQCAKDNEMEEAVEEISTESVFGSNGSLIISHKAAHDLQMSYVRVEAEKRILEAELAKEKAVKAAELKTAEAMKAQTEAEKDAQIAKLQMQLDFEKERAKMRAEWERERFAIQEHELQLQAKRAKPTAGLPPPPTSVAAVQVHVHPPTDAWSSVKATWLIVYEAEKALAFEDLNFIPKLKKCLSVNVGNRWASLINTGIKKRIGTMVNLIAQLCSQQRINGKVWMENQGSDADTVDKLRASDITDNTADGFKIRSYITRAPSSSTEDENGGAVYFPLVLVIG